MRILVMNHGEPWSALASTSLIKGLSRKYGDIVLDWATTENNIGIFRYNKKIHELIIGTKTISEGYDLAINLDPSSEEYLSMFMDIKATDKMGFGEKGGNPIALNKESEKILPILLNESKTSRHYLQIVYRITGMVWKGQGYHLAYYPRNKMKRKKTGIAVHHDKLRRYTKENLTLNYSDIWHVPMRHNVLKRIDEVNRVRQIVTDDLLCVHAAISMKKQVEYLDVNDLNMEIEFFGKGYHHRITNHEFE